MSVKDGVAWLKAEFAEARKTQKRKTGPYRSTVYEIIVPDNVELNFTIYGTEREIYAGSGRVAGSKPVELGTETLSVPAGTEVRVYGDPSKITVGSSVATFFIGQTQVTYKRDRNLVRNTPKK